MLMRPHPPFWQKAFRHATDKGRKYISAADVGHASSSC
jgi:hypothetical protein